MKNCCCGWCGTVALWPLLVTELKLRIFSSEAMDGDVIFGICLLILILSPFLYCCKWKRHEKTGNTESTENFTRMNTRRNAVIQLAEETLTDPSNNFRVPITRNFQQSLSVSLPPEIILTPSQHVINPYCDRPPSYESLFPK